MLPTTNRYGDLLREFYDGIKNDTMDSARLSEIQRLFNELSDREAVYRLWVMPSTNKIDPNKLFLPQYPKATYFEKTTTQSIPNGVFTQLSWDSATDVAQGGTCTWDSTGKKKFYAQTNRYFIVAGSLYFNGTGLSLNVSLDLVDIGSSVLLINAGYFYGKWASFFMLFNTFSANYIPSSTDALAISVYQSNTGLTAIDFDAAKMVIYEFADRKA